MRTLCLVVVLSIFPLTVRVDDPRFGLAGQIVPSGSLSVSYVTMSASKPRSTYMDFLVHPGLTYFIVDNLAIGGSIGYYQGYRTTEDESFSSSSQGFAVGPEIGYNIPLGDVLSLFPSVSILYSAGRSKASDGTFGTTKSSNASLSLTAQAWLLYHLTSHMFLGIGPMFSHELVDQQKVGDASIRYTNHYTSVSVASTIGAWF